MTGEPEFFARQRKNKIMDVYKLGEFDVKGNKILACDPWYLKEPEDVPYIT